MTESVEVFYIGELKEQETIYEVVVSDYQANAYLKPYEAPDAQLDFIGKTLPFWRVVGRTSDIFAALAVRRLIEGARIVVGMPVSSRVHGPR